MMIAVLVVALLHFITDNIEGSHWNYDLKENHKVSSRNDQSSDVPLLIFIIQHYINPDNTATNNKPYEGLQLLSPKDIARQNIRNIHDIRHDPAFSSHYYLKRRRQRCHIRRRLCIYGECVEHDVECIHYCRVSFNACYHMPTFDDDFPAFPNGQTNAQPASGDITFDDIMSGKF